MRQGVPGAQQLLPGKHNEGEAQVGLEAVLPPPHLTGKLAIIDGARQLSFGWLHAHTERLQAVLTLAVLRPHGFETCPAAVGLLSRRSAEAVAGMIAIWLAGAVYLPLDPELPTVRLSWLLEESRPSAVLCDRASLPLPLAPTNYLRPATVSLETGRVHRSWTGGGRLVCPLPPGCAYLMYTSGSTGRPKAVLGSTAGLAARCMWGREARPFARGEMCAAIAPVSFVDSLAETMVPLGAGAPLLLLSADSLVSSPRLLLEQLSAWRVTRLLLTPTALRLLCTAAEAAEVAAGQEEASMLAHLRLLSLSGEAAPRSLLGPARHLCPSAEIRNLYGLTEAAGDVTCAEIQGGVGGDAGRGEDLVRSGAMCPLGWALASSRGPLALLRLDRGEAGAERGAQAGGDVGEILVGGPAVALGYLARPELTQRAFFDRADDTADEEMEGVERSWLAGLQVRWLRTGDLGRYGAGGELHYCGRVDSQLQVRISPYLLTYPRISPHLPISPSGARQQSGARGGRGAVLRRAAMA